MPTVVGVDTNRQLSKGAGSRERGQLQLALECHVNVLPNEADTLL